MIAPGRLRLADTVKLTLVASLALLGGCFDPIVGYPCAPGHGMQSGVCVPLGSGGAGGDAAGGSSGGDARDGGDMAGGSAGDGGADRSGDLPEDWVYPDGPDEDGGDGAGGSGAGGSAAGGSGAGGSAAGGSGAGGSGTDGSGTGGTSTGGTSTGGTGTGGTAGGSGTDGPDGPAPGDGPDGPAPTDAPDGPDPADAPDAPPPLVCMMGLTNCSEQCVDMTSDPDNCGACANRCGSGLCLGSMCQQQGVGHVVVIGHDYVVQRTGMNNLIGNSVFLSGDDPVTVLVYEGNASPQSIAGTNAAIDQVASVRGRRWTRQVVAAADVVSRLPGADTFLIYAQQGASDAQLLQHGVDWGPTMTTFVNSGRAVVLLDGPSMANAGTFQVLTSAGLFTAVSRTDVTGQTLTVVAGGDATAVRVPRTYRGEMSSVAFTTVEVVKVVQTMGGDAVVIHKIF